MTGKLADYGCYIFCSRCKTKYSTAPEDYFMDAGLRIFECCGKRCWLVGSDDKPLSASVRVEHLSQMVA